MKTKTIFKTLALAMLMPTMLLTTACSNDDDVVNNAVNTENTINKGYALPVTVNVTRQGDAATRATYTDNGNGTGSLAFSAGDKLFVSGFYDDDNLYDFVGVLTWQPGDTFSGTIYLEGPFEGTAEELLSSALGADATLLPAGYDGYGFLGIDNEGTCAASLNFDYTKAFALTKATAVEQFSYESTEEYNNGFALSPERAIVCFTISGLEANKKVAVSFKCNHPWGAEYSWSIDDNVTVDATGVATFAVGMAKNENFTNYSLTVDGNAITLPADKEVEAGKIYNISRSVAASSSLTGQFSVSTTKKVCFSKGNLQATYDGTDWTWGFAANQWDYIGSAAGNTSINGNGTVSASNVTVDLFGWVGASSMWTGAAQYGISNSTATDNTNGYGNNASEALKSDWGNTISDGYTWFTLTSAEWTYLFNTRSASTVGGTENGRYAKAKVNDVQGVILFPDTYTHPDGVTAPTGVNATDNTGWNGNNYDATAWAKMEAAGCVFLPAAGNRSRASVSDAGSYGYYWSSSSTSSVDYAYYVYFYSGSLRPASSYYRDGGLSVRLVRVVE